MAKPQYNPKNFMRQTSNSLLQSYFHQRTLLTNLDFTSLDETEVDAIYAGWLELPPAPRAEIDEDFRAIDSLANERGILMILEESRMQGRDAGPEFEKLSDFPDKAFWSFLHLNECFEAALRFREADDLPSVYWRERNGISDITPRSDEAALAEMAYVLKIYFLQKEGRGHHCYVDYLQRGPRHYYFAYPEDHSRRLLEFEGDEDRPRLRLHRPTFEVIFVYDSDLGELSTFYKGRAREVRDLQALFARVILAINLPSPKRDTAVYELNPLKYRDFQFRYEPTSGITGVKVKQIKLAVIGGRRRCITLDVDHSGGHYDLYDSMVDFLNTGVPASKDNRIPLAMVDVKKVGITANFLPSGRRKHPSKTFYVGYPNSCNLKREGQDLALRQMLIDSGIEPKAPGKR
jgi:hypothetical protein